MADRSTFYLATGGAAATLLGLLFIAVQFNIDTFVLDPGNKWRALARSTFSMFTILFFLPLLLLVPGTDPSGQGIVLLGAAGYGAIGAVLTWLPVWRSIFQGRRERLWQTAWLLIAPSSPMEALRGPDGRYIRAATCNMSSIPSHTRLSGCSLSPCGTPGACSLS